jgi:hypothetical protein
MHQQMLHLDRHIVGKLGELLMHRLDDAERMSWAIKEVRVAEAYALRSRHSLLANVAKNNLPGDDAKPAIVDGHYRAVPAPVLATAARLHIAGRPLIAVR